MFWFSPIWCKLPSQTASSKEPMSHFLAGSYNMNMRSHVAEDVDFGQMPVVATVVIRAAVIINTPHG